MSEVLLSLNNISKQYPGVLALDDVSIQLNKGETLALCGENGAGKSTLIKVLSGAIMPSDGTIVYEGKEYREMNPQVSSSLGISVIYQEFNLMNTLSVAENVFAGRLPKKNGLYNAKEIEIKAKEIFDMMGVDIDVNQKVENLSVAYMQLVEIAKSVSKDLKLLVMDEPTAPLTANETELLFKIVGKLKEKGISIIFVTHRLVEVFRICDRVVIMRDGKKVSESDIKDITKEELIRGMVGRDISSAFPTRQAEIGGVVLDVKNLSGNGVSDVSFQLHKGEILGFAGLVGAGRTEIMRILYGADRGGKGDIYLNGKLIENKSPRDAVNNGIVLLPEDRKRHGAILGIPIRQNISLPNLRSVSKFGMLKMNLENKVIDEQISSLKIACYSSNQLAMTLSGGNQQKVVLAKWLATNAQVFIFDEPTRGIDVGAKREIYYLMNGLCEQGKSIIMISSEMEELIGMSDRLVVLYEGKQMGTLEKDQFSQENVLTLASGEIIRS